MTMKRRRKPVSSETQLSKRDDDQIQLSGPSINDLPVAIVFDIVLKLPVKSIVMCKSVCKTWHSLISDPRFVELHLARSKTQTLIRNKHKLMFSRSLYLLEPEDVCGPDSGYCQCRANSADKCEHLHFDTTVASKLKIPLRNSQVMLDKVKNRHGDDAMFCVTSKSETKDLKKLKSNDHSYDVANSCNGLLLLSKRILRGWSNPIVVCNPLTGEFAYLPEDYNGLLHSDINCPTVRLGFSPKHNQYKAIRILRQLRTNPFDIPKFYYMAQIHTLGTDSWRNIDISAFELGFLCSPAYLDGALHWVFKDIRGSFKLASFDLDQEIFQIHCFPSPPPHYGAEFTELAITVIGGRLYLYTDFIFTHMAIWVMCSNGISKSWINLFFFDVSKFHCFHKYRRYELISILNEESLVMFGGPFGEFVYYDKSNGPRFKHLKFKSLSSEFEAISYTPSFISLKDVEVLNINSGCGKLRLLEETYPLLLRGGKN